MRETITLRLHPDGERAAWRVHRALDADGDTTVTPVADALDACDGRRVVLIVPGVEVLLTEVRLPLRQPAKLLQAIPYALEDQLAEDVDQLHFCPGPRQADGAVPVAVVARRRMDAWLAPFLDRGIRPDAAHPDVLCLPPPDAEEPAWNVLLEPEQALMRSGRWQGFACERELLGELAALADPPPDLRVKVYMHDRGNATPGMLPGLVTRAEAGDDALGTLIRGSLARRAIDLLQGPYGLGRERRQWWRPWRATAGLAAALLVLHLGAQTLSLWRLSARAAALEAEATATFQALFPEVERIVAMRVQAERRLAALGQGGGGGDAGLLFLLARAAEALAQTSGLTLTEAAYDDGRLALSLRGDDLQALERLRAEFAASPGVALDVESASADERGVRIRVTLRAEAQPT